MSNKCFFHRILLKSLQLCLEVSKVKQIVKGKLARECQKNLSATETQGYKGYSELQGCNFMLVNNLEHLNQKGCNINTAVFLEISVLRQGTLVLPLTKGGFHVVHLPKVQYVSLDVATV